MNNRNIFDSYSTIYVVISKTARTVPDFPIRGYAGPSGRLDVIARSVASLFSVSKKGRDLFIAVLLGKPYPPKFFLIDKKCIEKNVSEKSIMRLLRILLSKPEYKGCKNFYVNSLKELFNIINELNFRLILLEESGTDIEEFVDLLNKDKIAFILGSHVDIPDYIKEVIKKLGAISVSIEAKSLLTSHVILYIAYLRALGNLFPSIDTITFQ